jgi:hypothetical protein
MLAVVAVVLGAIAWWQFNENPAAYRNKGLAVAAVCLGGGVLLVYAAILMYFFATAMMSKHP